MDSFLWIRKSDWLLVAAALIFAVTILSVAEFYPERPSKAQLQISNNAQQCLSNNAIETCLDICEGFSEKSRERNTCVSGLLEGVSAN